MCTYDEIELTSRFDELLNLIEGGINKQDTVMRAAVPAIVKLAETLHVVL